MQARCVRSRSTADADEALVNSGRPLPGLGVRAKRHADVGMANRMQHTV